jgi:hypothetical protein
VIRELSWQVDETQTTAELVEFLKPYDRKIQKLALDLRSIVVTEFGHVTKTSTTPTAQWRWVMAQASG